MRAILCGLLVVVSVGTAAGRQLKPRLPGTAAIAGRVIHAQSGATLSGVRVSLNEINPPIGFGFHRDSVTTDNNGTFAFEGIPSGTYSLRGQREGYLEGGYGSRRPGAYEHWFEIQSGARLQEALVELWQEPSISGRVVDENNRPLVGAVIEAWPQRVAYWVSSGFRQSRPVGADGRYRISSLPPNDYLVVLRVHRRTQPLRSEATGTWLVPHQLSTELYPRLWIPPPDENGKPRTYGTVFAPGVTAPAQASVYQLRVGEALTDIDFVARTVVGVTVRGQLERASGKPIGDATEITLRHAGSPDKIVVARAWLEKNPNFVFLDVPPGRYILEVQLLTWTGSHTFMGEQPMTRMMVDVPAGGLDSVKVPIAEGTSLQGRLAWVGQSPRPQLSLWLRSYEHPYRFPEPGDSLMPADRRESFRISSIEAGRYAFRVLEATKLGWAVESMTLNGQNLAVEPVDPRDADITDVLVTVTDRPATVTGHVESGGLRVRDATVVMFPSDVRVWSRANAALMGYPTTRAVGGSFRLAGVIPGDYLIAAVDDARLDDWPTESLLRDLQSLATPVTVSRGSVQTLVLELRRAR